MHEGDRYGLLTAVHRVDRTRYGHRRWMFRCDCGGFAIRDVGAIRQSVRDNHEPSCVECRRELGRGVEAARADALREAYRRQMVDYGTLWLHWQTAALVANVRNDLEAAFGEVERDPFVPHPLSSFEAGYPYSFGDVASADLNWRRYHKQAVPEAAHGPWHDDNAAPLTDAELVAIASLEES